MSNVFDKVWHHGLITKLRNLGINNNVTRILIDFLNNRTFKVKIANATSSEREIKAGVPQGSVLGPMLYNICTHDIPKNPATDMALYADDIAITALDRNLKKLRVAAQNALNNINAWSKKWRIAINAQKSTAVIYTMKKKYKFQPLTLQDNGIPCKQEAKHLGIKRLTWRSHIYSAKSKGNALIKLLYPMLKRKSLGLRTKRLLFTTYIQPTILYGSILWRLAA